MSTIHVKNLTKHFRVYEKEPGFLGSLKSVVYRKHYNKTAIHDVSFDIEEGELVGFIGPNGAGKTTTLKCLSGLIHPSSGDIEVLGYTPYKRNHDFLRKISLVMGQKNQLWWDLPAYESFLLNKEIYDIPEAKFKKNLSDLVEMLDVKDVLNIQVRQLSLGQRMKCELIGQLLHSPKILFLDEPTIGLDVVVQHNVRNFVREYNKNFNATIILTSHYMADVRDLCKRIIVIDHGTIIYDGSFSELITKYTKNKLLSVVFTEPVDRVKLEKLAEIKKYKPQKVVLAVSKETAKTVAATLLQDFPVDDLNIEEPNIEDVIRSFFKTIS
jgi:ABC-2 type transport system ATP-binding protein